MLTTVDSIGRGGFGRIYKVRHELDGQFYALKKVRLRRGGTFFRQAVEEIRILATADHPNVVRYHTAWVSDGHLNIQMELCHFSLREYLDCFMERSPPPPRVSTEDICFQVVAGVSYLHEFPVVHGDLKPENILLKRTRFGTLQVKIADFGLGRYLHDSLSFDGGGGTVLYMAPEFPKGLASDVYSLGVVFLELFSGFTTHMERVRAVQALKVSRKVCTGVGHLLGYLILTMTERDPSRRPTASWIFALLRDRVQETPLLCRDVVWDVVFRVLEAVR